MGVTVRLWKGQRGVYGVFLNHRGQRKAKKIGDKRAAEAVASQLRTALAAGQFALPTSQPELTFTALAEEWLETYPVTNSIGANTVENYTSVVRAHLIPHFQRCAVHTIDHAMVERFVILKRKAGGRASPTARPLGDGSLKGVLVVLAAHPRPGRSGPQGATGQSDPARVSGPPCRGRARRPVHHERVAGHPGYRGHDGPFPRDLPPPLGPDRDAEGGGVRYSDSGHRRHEGDP
jgi:Phage integrase, N-terminal SAM-like domain